MKFIHFGCWNEFNCNKDDNKINGISAVTAKLRELDNRDINFIVVSGDNYYPTKSKKKEGKQKKNEQEEDEQKEESRQKECKKKESGQKECKKEEGRQK